MPELPKPHELLDLVDGASATFRVLRWEAGELVITPAHAPGGKLVSVLRVHVPVADKPLGLPYYDITSARLVAQLRPYLERADLARARFKVTALGIPPKKYFSLEIIPV